MESSASALAKPSQFFVFSASQIAFSLAIGSLPVVTVAGVEAGLAAGLGDLVAAGEGVGGAGTTADD